MGLALEGLLNLRLERGEITETDWYRELADVIAEAYRPGNNPSGLNGRHQDLSLLIDALASDGAFLDTAAWTGRLLAALTDAAAERGLAIEPHALCMAPELAERVRQWRPQMGGRIHVGTAIDWAPPRRYRYVRTGLECPHRCRRDLVRRLLDDVVEPGGRLIVGIIEEHVAASPTLADELGGWGFTVTGSAERRHLRWRWRDRVLWIDR